MGFSFFKRRKDISKAIERAVPNQREIVSKEIDKSFKAYVIRQFKKNKRALFSFYFALLLSLVALFADFLANEKPLVAKHKGNIYFPVLKEYAVTLGLSTWQEEFQNVTWRDLQYDWVLWPPIPYLPQNLDFRNSQFVGPFEEQDIPSAKWKHWLGTDELGRDVMAGMIHGTRIAFLVGIISMSIASLIGILMGSLAGFLGDDGIRISRVKGVFIGALGLLGLFYGFGVRSYVLSDTFSSSLYLAALQIALSFLIFFVFLVFGYFIATPFEKIPLLGKRFSIPVDIIITRIIEIIDSVPRLILIMSIVAIAKPSIFIVMVIIGLTSWTGIARFIRAELLRVRSLEYMEAANALGYSKMRSLFKHAIPNSLSPVFISIAFGIAAAILVESTLSFLGIGVAAETITWGKLLSISRRASDAWWLAVFPGFAIFLTVTVFNLIGEGLTDALDPRLKS